MPNHEFSRLSSYDFEELVRDLLQAETGLRFECFTAGRDAGIDLRCLHAPDDSIIVQCKHSQNSGYPKLLSHLRRVELPKVRALAPPRYVLATSLGLTPGNKDELSTLFAPFVRGPHDIFGRDDINNLLRRHPAVEIANFKLWLTSTDVLQRVMHNAEKCQTEFEVERISRKLPIFVQSEAFPRALKILEDTRIVVISGVPGIGKTTLADMLLYSHLEQGFEPIVIQEKIEEAKRLFAKSQKQIFYFDDFLGQVFLHDRPDQLKNNEDAALISFMEAVRHSKVSRFILTTREHILKNALIASERLARSPILEHRCILELRDYDFAQRARILYNHLYFSDLPVAYKESILKDEFYFDIVRHRNFNPRIIEWLSGYIRVREVEAPKYCAYISKLLNSPEQIWSHAFEQQICEASRSILLTLSSLGGSTEVVDLEPAWLALHRYRAQKYNFTTSARDFRRALDELEGSFLKLEPGRVDFLNPSIRDFMAELTRNSTAHIQDIVSSAIRFKQIMGLRQLGEVHSTESLKESVLKETPDILSAVERVLYGPELRWMPTATGGRRGIYVDTPDYGRLCSLISWAEASKSNGVMDLVLKLSSYLLSNTRHIDIIESTSIIEAFDGAPWVQAQNSELRRQYLDAILRDLRAVFPRHYEWRAILKYQKACPEWTDADAKVLDEALQQYQVIPTALSIDRCP